MQSPKEEHLQAVYRVLSYLKGSPRKGLRFRNNNSVQVEAYSDADWAGSIIDRRFTSGYFSFIIGNLDTWRNKKQSVAASCNAEAEFRAAAHAIRELL